MLLEEADQKLIAQLLEIQPDSVVWFTPVFAPDSSYEKKLIVDFEPKYCNAAACKILGVEPGKVLSSTLLSSSLMDESSRRQIFEQCLTVWNTETAIEFTYYSPGFDKYFNVQRSKVMHGILSITRDRTSEVKAEQNREKQSKLLNKIINNSPTCIVLCEALRNQAGKIYDFTLLMVNDKIANDLRRTKEEIVGMTYCTLHPDVKSNGLIDILASVAETGTAFSSEVYLEIFGGWFHLSADKVDNNQVIATYLNINEAKNHTQKLEQQTQWHNRILEHSVNGIIALQSIRNARNEIEDFEIKLCNPAAAGMYNLPALAMGRKMSSAPGGVVTQDYMSLHKKVAETGVPHRDLLRVNNGLGENWYQISISKLDDGVVSNLIDVTELKQQERINQEQAELLNMTLNSSLNGVYTMRAMKNNNGEVIDFEITHVNDVFCEASKKRPEELIGNSYLQLFPHTRASGSFDRNCKVIKTGKSIREESHYNGDGIDSWFDTSISRIGDDKIVIAFNDISALKKAAVQLEKSNVQLQKSNERLSEFSHVASHDLNEPLRKIMTFTQLLNERYAEKLEPGARDYMMRINKTANRMQALINDLLSYSRISNSIQQSEVVSLNGIVQGVLNDLEASIHASQAKFTIAELPAIQGDKTQLRQIFQNLISNAIKFRKNETMPQIDISYSAKVKRNGKAYMVINVQDNGIGFDQSDAEKIFELFQRLHGKHEFEGTGIGLAIVQKAMENHQGFIEVSSEPGVGSCFKLYFPEN